MSTNLSIAYPEKGRVIEIGAVAGQSIRITEKNYETDQLDLVSPDCQFNLSYESGTRTITAAGS